MRHLKADADRLNHAAEVLPGVVDRVEDALNRMSQFV